VNRDRGNSVIAGVGESAYARELDLDDEELAVEAGLAAAADAGFDPASIDGLCRFAGLEQVDFAAMCGGLGMRELRFFAEFPFGAEAIAGAVSAAAAAIEAGQATRVLVYRSLTQGSQRRRRRDAPPSGPRPPGPARAPRGDGAAFAWTAGQIAPAVSFGLMASAYAARYEVDADDFVNALGTVAVTQREWAADNPRAILRDSPLTLEEHRESPLLADPLRTRDLCLESDGAAAFIVSARGDGVRGVEILAAKQYLDPRYRPFSLDRDDLHRIVPPEAATPLYSAAGVSPSRIRTAQMYDASTFMVLQMLEAYQLVEEGRAWRHVLETGLGPGTPLPVNTAGGNLAEAYVHGVNGFVEAVRQVRGDSANAVLDADVALFGAPLGGGVILGAA